MKKGFTLVELLGVITLLGVIGLIVIPIVNDATKRSKEQAYEVQINEIKKAAGDWALANAECLPTTDNATITITLGRLKKGSTNASDLCYGDKGGYIDKEITNPKTGELFPDTTQIIIKRVKNNFTYEVKAV